MRTAIVGATTAVIALSGVAAWYALVESWLGQGDPPHRAAVLQADARPARAVEIAPVEIVPVEIAPTSSVLRQRIDVAFIGTPLLEVMTNLAKVAGDAEFTIEIDAAALKAEGLSLNEPVDFVVDGITVGQALWRILEPRDLRWIPRDGGILVTSRVREEQREATKTYAVDRILRAIERERAGRRDGGVRPDGADFEYPPAEMLANVLQDTSSGIWFKSSGSGGTVEVVGRRFQVRQTHRVHEEVAWLLAALDRFTRGEFRGGCSLYDPPWSPPEDAAAIDRALGATLGAISWNDTPLVEAMSQLAESSGLHILFDEVEMQNEGINRDEPLHLSAQRVTLASVLGRVLTPLELTAVSDHGFLLIAPRRRMEEMLRVGVYDLRDLVDQGLSNGTIVDAIMSSTRASWISTEETGAIATPLRGCLVVRHHEECHREIAALIEDWRAAMKSARIEAADRFLGTSLQALGTPRAGGIPAPVDAP